MTNFISVIKELRLFIALFITAGWITVFETEVVLNYVYMYNIHLVVVIVGGIYINNFLSNKQHKEAGTRLDLYQEQLNSVILDSNRSQLKAEIRQAFKDYYNVKVIDFPTTIKYIRGLEARRISAKLNSDAEDMTKILINKFKH